MKLLKRERSFGSVMALSEPSVTSRAPARRGGRRSEEVGRRGYGREGRKGGRRLEGNDKTRIWKGRKKRGDNR